MIMPLPDLLTHFSGLDAFTLVAPILAWLGSTLIIERRGATKPSTHMLMETYRDRWMLQMVTRTPRIFGSAVLGIMRQGATFFASSCCMIAALTWLIGVLPLLLATLVTLTLLYRREFNSRTRHALAN